MFKSRISRLSLGFGLLAGSLAVASAALPASPVSAARSAKITICHRTHAVNNPYRRITVAQSSITKNNGHGDAGARNTHNKAADVNPTRIVWDPTYSYPDAPNKVWDDIIPDASAGGGSAGIAKNFTGRGLAIYNGTVDAGGYNHKNTCKKMTAKQFYDSEVAEGQDPAKVLEDLDEQDTNEDKKLKELCGGSFVGCDPNTWNNKVNVETKDPSGVTKTAARLNGVVTCGSDSLTSPTKYYFEWSTDSALAGANQTTVTAVASNGQTVNVDITGLTTGTYYYRTVCVTDYEKDTEGVLEGVIKSFSITPNSPDTTAPSTDTTVPSSGPNTAPPADPSKGKISGIVWLEIKKDAVRQTKEPALSGLTVRLKSNGVVVSTATTGANGGFVFDNLVPGTYVVEVVDPDGDGIDPSSDSDGTKDWIVTVTVKAGEVSIVEYAAVGTAKTGGTAFREVNGTRTTLKNANVTCVWTGADGKAGTDDDVEFTTTTDDEGTYLIKDIPAGEYSCSAKDPVTNKVTSFDLVRVKTSSAKLSDAAVKTAVLKIKLASAQLPETGRDNGALLWSAFATLLGGAFLLGLRRRLNAR